MNSLRRSFSKISVKPFIKNRIPFLFCHIPYFFKEAQQRHFSIFDIKNENENPTDINEVHSGELNKKSFVQMYKELIQSKKIEEDPYQKKLILVLQVLENNINEFHHYIEVNDKNIEEKEKKKKSLFSYLFTKNKKEEEEDVISSIKEKEKEIIIENLKNDDNFFLYTNTEVYKKERENWRYSKINTEEDCFQKRKFNGNTKNDKYNYEKKRGISYIRGIYIHGSVGRGKTYFLNLLFDRIKVNKLKIHYHNFMQEVHKCFHEEKLSNSIDPIKNVAIKINKKYKLIFIDEFQVVHISDAMVIKSLFKYLFEFGTIFLFSSNRNPIHLYYNGLNRDQFIPFIKLLFHYNYIYEIYNFCDFRVKNKSIESNIYNIPNRSLEEIKKICVNMYSSAYNKDLAFIKNIEKVNVEFPISPSKKIVIPYKLNEYSIFSFYNLCSQNISIDEYSAIAKEHHTLFIYDLVQMSEEFNGNEMRRFILLMDILYEKNIRVFFFSNLPIFQIFQTSEIISYFQMLTFRLKQKYESFNHFVESVQDLLKSNCFDEAIFLKILSILGLTKGIAEKLFYAIKYNINKEFIPIEYLRNVLCFHIASYEIDKEKHLKFLHHKNSESKLEAIPYLLFDENITDTSQENVFASMRTLSRMKDMSTTSYLEKHKKLYTHNI